LTAWWTWLLLGTALVVAVAVAIEMVRRPILARMATRNAVRRPRQTSTVVAGLMVGTAIISAALVAGGSAASAIRGYVYQSLGDIDESVAIEGYPYFPQAVYDAFRSSQALDGHFDAVAANAIWGAAIDDPRTDLFEPNIALVGFEPQRDAGFGDFELKGGGHWSGADLQPGSLILTDITANALDAKVGDKVTLSFTPPIDPILPDLQMFSGNVTSAQAPGPLGPILGPVQPAPSTHTVLVNRSASAMVVVLGWDPAVAPTLPPTVALDLVLTDPQGHAYSASSSPDSPTVPLLLNVTVPPDQTLPPGEWTLSVSSPAAVQAHYQGVAVVAYPVYDLALLRQRARALGGDTGMARDLDILSTFTDRHTANLTVAAITTGGRGDQFDFREAAFLRMDELQGLLGREGQVNLLKFSNPGSDKQGVQGTDKAVPLLNGTLQEVKGRYPDVASVQSLEVQPLKRKFLDVADEAGQTLTGLLVFAGSLSIITGLLLITNIFTMLAEERRSELGMARAVGLTRKDLVRLFLFEGSLYAVAAAALGAFLGLGLAAVMVWILNALISNLAPNLSFPPIPFQPTPTALLLAFSIGSLLTFATIAFASRRQARLNVVRAIRRIDEPERTGDARIGLLVGLPVAVLGLVAVAVGFADNGLTRALVGNHAFSLQVFGGLLAAVGALVALRPRMRRRVVLPVCATALAAYYTATYFLIHHYDNIPEANVIGPIRGVLLTLCVVVLAVHADALTRLFGRALARIPALRAVGIPAVSYPLHRKFRTGMTLAMFSVVILSIGFFSIFGALFQVDPARQTGGYDVEASTTLSVPDLAPYDRGLVPEGTFASVQHLTVYNTEDPDFITVSGGRTGSYTDFHHQVFGYDSSFAADQHFRLLFRDANYSTDRAAYDAVLAGGDAIIVSYQYSTNERNQDLSHRIGETLQMHLGNETLDFRIIGIQEQYHYPGVFLPRPLVDGLFPDTQDLFLYRTAPGIHADAAAKALEKNYRDVGLDAQDSKAKVLDEQKSFRQILGAMKLFLALGLIVGVLSLGIVTSRSVLERRQEIGMLRALGFTGNQVRSIFLIEVTMTILVGALIGIACAIVVTYGLWFSLIRQLHYPYVIPWGEISILLGASTIVALLATAAPIGRSAKVAPAEALRYLE
jgi:putative ABC transport system permease protein